MQNAPISQAANILGLDHPKVWDTDSAFQHLQALGKVDSKRTAERRLQELQLLPEELTDQTLQDECGRPANPVVLNWAIEKSRSQRKLVLMVQLFPLPNGHACLHANDARGARYWLPMTETNQELTAAKILESLLQLQQYIAKAIAVFPHGQLVGLLRDVRSFDQVTLSPSAYLPTLNLPKTSLQRSATTPHLRRLEAESIHIIREAVA